MGLKAMIAIPELHKQGQSMPDGVSGSRKHEQLPVRAELYPHTRHN